ncbi:MAG: Hsp20/alpha crystallin family protein [Parcubacteria group bacterium]|nr:Hsp20/alpha crystallin family protein [Parcubacteria group bacterium]
MPPQFDRNPPYGGFLFIENSLYVVRIIMVACATIIIHKVPYVMNNENNKRSSRTMARYEPARFVSPMREMMDRLGDRLLSDDFIMPRMPFAFDSDMMRGVKFPKVDISENEKEIVVTANIPGLGSENIQIDVDDDSVSLSGSIEKEKKEGKEGETFYRYEREYGEFRREFALPSRVNKDGVSAITKNGVLTITLPKVESDTKKRVSVKEE